MNALKKSAPQRATVAEAQDQLHDNITSPPNRVKPLAITFVSGGFRFFQIHRVGQVALFLKRKHPSGTLSYEVVKIRQLSARAVFEVEYPASEAMPPSERLGVDGWTFADINTAQSKFRALAEAQDTAALCTHPPENLVFNGGTNHDEQECAA